MVLKKKNIWKIIVAVIAVFMAVWMVAQPPVTIAAQTSTTYYIKEIAVESDPDANVAKKKLIDNGYILSEQPIYNANGTVSYLGYKITTDATDGITRINAMRMNGGFTTMTYGDMAYSNYNKLALVADELMFVIKEFAENYKDGNKKNAQTAFEILNYYTFEKDGADLKLGDYFVSSDVCEKDVIDIILITSNSILMAIYTQLVFGISNDSAYGEKNFLDKLCERGPIDTSKCVDENKKLDESLVEAMYVNQYDSIYMSRAANIWSGVKLFADNYKDAIAAYPYGTSIMYKTNDYTSETMGSEIGGQLDEATQDTEIDNVHATYLALYKVLDEKIVETIVDPETGDETEIERYKYEYGKDKNGNPMSLAKFFVEIGSANEKSEAEMIDAYRKLYPLIALNDNGESVLSRSQEIMLKYTGFTTVLSCDTHTKESIEVMNETVDSIISEMHELGADTLSIWYDVDRSVYDEEIGVTSRQLRSMASQNQFNILTEKGERFDKNSTQKERLRKLSNVLGIVAGAAGLLSIIGMVGAGGIILSASTFAYVMLCAVMTLKAGGLTIGMTLSCIATLVGGALFFIGLVVGIVALIIIIISMIKDDEEDPPVEYEDEVVYTTIPTRMFDSDNETSTYPFSVVNNTSGKPMDICNWKSKEWVALYTSKDKEFGEPITVLYDGTNYTCFELYYDHYETKDDYAPLTYFGEISAARLNYADGGQGLFLTYRKEGTKKETVLGGKYIKNVMVSSRDTVEAAKLELKNSGYIVVDEDLTPKAYYSVKKYVNRDWLEKKEIHTYVGYTTTDNPNEAITDLRVSYGAGKNVKGDSIVYGGASYGVCGGFNEIIIWQTHNKNAGEPILAGSLEVVSSIEGLNELGFEGVNLFSGGIAFNFNIGNDFNPYVEEYNAKSTFGNWGGSYLVFLTDKPYTAKNSQKYLGGIAFFSGDTYNGISIDYFAKSMGYILLEPEDYTNVTMDLGGPQYGSTMLYYSYTYNPRRAITNIVAYTSEPACQQLPYSLGVGSTSYVATDTFVQGGLAVGNDKRLIRASHSYVTSNFNEGGSGTFDGKNDFDTIFRTLIGDSAKTKVNYINNSGATVTNVYKPFIYDLDLPLAFENRNGEIICKSLPEMTLYVTGATGEEAILVDSLFISSESKCGYEPIRSIKDWYSDEAANLCYNADGSNTKCYYLFIKKSIKERPKYVENVVLKYFDNSSEPPNNYDMIIFNLASEGEGKLIEVNLASDTNTPWLDVLTTEGYVYNPNREVETRYIYHKKDAGNERNYKIQLDTYDKNVAYIWVTYTNTKILGLKDINIVESDSPDFAKSYTDVKLNPYQLAGDAFQYKNSGKYYALYTGGSGDYISDVIVTDDVFAVGCKVATGKLGIVPTYQEYFIQLKEYVAKPDPNSTSKLKSSTVTMYPTKITVASGSTSREAQLNLLALGCRKAIPYNINPAENSYTYVGVVYAAGYQDAYSALILNDGGQNTSIDQIGYKGYLYDIVSKDLNYKVYDSNIYIYGTKDKTLAKRAVTPVAKKDKDGRYITDIAFFSATNLNEYVDNPSKINELPEEEREYVLSLISDVEGNAKYWNIVTDTAQRIINVNTGGYLESGEKAELYMYVHYSNNAVVSSSNMLGTIFTDSTIVMIVIISSVAVFAAVGIIIAKKKKRI